MGIPIIDTHIHLYDTNRPGGVPWPPKSDSLLYKATLPEHFNEVARQNGIAATVIVEASDKFKDNKWLLDITKNEKQHYTGIVGNLILGSPEFKAQLEELCQDNRFVGIRMRPNKQYPYFSETFWRNLKLLESKGKTLDILMKGISLPQVAKIAQKNPNLKIMINHLTGISLKNPEAINSLWKAQVKQCAAYKNVYCKFSGFLGRSGLSPASQDVNYYQPLVEYLVKSFGENRLVYGSNWPVLNKFGNYEGYRRLVLNICRLYGQSFAKKVLYRNAIEFYGLPQLKL